MEITKLKGHIPDFICDQLQDVVDKFDINTISRLSHFLGQCSEETGNFTVFRENMNYSAAQMMKVWPSRFPTLEKAKEYEYQPQKLANLVYGYRGGNTLPDSGWKWRGGGCIQTTFYDNYLALSRGINAPDLLEDPDLITTKYALISAAFYWKNRGCNILADAGVNEAAIEAVTKRVNGTLGNLAARVTATNKYFNLLNVAV